MKARRVKYSVAIVLGVFLFCGQLVFAMEPSISILGDVVGSGSAEMKAAFNRWISVSGKTFPVIDGANLRSGNGMMSLIFRDAARMDVGKNSEIMVTGSRGNYSINVTTGQIAFSVPKGIAFSVKTPTSTIHTKASTDLIRKVSLASQDEVKGVVTYDGKGTRVTAINGNLAVRSGIGVQLQTVTAGNSIYIEGKDAGSVRTVQLFGGSAPADRLTDPVTPFFVAGGGIGGSVGGYFLVNSFYHEASPRQ
ncbi:MAG TPA: FecR domain-containing protein [Thermodesulfovibrionales bacterium]|nr:FecR domain-containing protein [Thermodesulfovibrionales bacterium]